MTAKLKNPTPHYMDKAGTAAARDEAISRAEYFTAYFRIDATTTLRAEFQTLAAAEDKAAEWNAAHGQYGRRTLISAIDSSGRAIPL